MVTVVLRVCLFGQPRFDFDGLPLKFSVLPKTLPLCAYLLLQRAQPVARDTVAFTLWPDRRESGARANLRRHLHDLRRALPGGQSQPAWILSDADTVQWNPAAAVWLDVAEFERASASAAATVLAEAVALYSGDLFATLYDDWIFPERERLRNQYLSVLNQLVAEHRAQRDYAPAIAYAQRLLSQDPLRTDVVRQLMSLRYEAGDSAGALQEYKVFVRLLRSELGVEPTPELEMLRDAIVQNAPLPGAARGTQTGGALGHAGAQSLRTPLPLVGRESELEQLRAAWARAAHAPVHGGLVLIGGEAGVGKTRLSAELAQQAEDEGARVVSGVTTQAEPVPYQAVAAALRSALPLLAALEVGPIWLAAIAALIPELRARRPDLPLLPPLDADRDQTRLFEAVARVLAGLALPRPVLLILEDLHWAGAATMALLEFLARRAPQHSLLIVADFRDEQTSRNHPLRELRRRLQREDLVSPIALGRLSPEAVGSLVARVPGLAAVAGDMASRLYAESEGNPLFLGERIRDLLESGQGDVTLAPLTIEAIIASRLRRLSDQGQALAAIAAVAGLAFDVELVAQVAGWGEDQVLHSLDELLDHQVLRAIGGRQGADYAFTHHLIQAAVYAGIPEDDLRRRHRRVAQVMEEIYAPRLDEIAAELALHFDRGQAPAPAAQYYLRAGRRALAVSAADEALAHLSRGLELATDMRLRFDLLALAEIIHAHRGQRAEQRSALAQLDQAAQALGDAELICEVLRRQIRLAQAVGERSSEAELIAALSTRAATPRWQAEALQAAAAHALLLSQFDEARPLAEQTLALWESLEEASGQVECYALLAEAAVLQGHFAEAQEWLGRATALAGSQSNPSLVIRTLRSAAMAAMVQVDVESAQRLGQQMLELCRKIGDRVGEADAHARLGSAAARAFQVAAARQHYEQAEELYGQLGDRKGRAATVVNAAMLLANLGHYAEALAQDRRAATLFQGLDDLRGQAVSAINLAWHATLQGDYATARDSATRGLELARAMNSPVYEAYALSNLGAAERELGELPSAIEHMQAGIALRQTLGQTVEYATDLCDLTVAYLRAGNISGARQTADEMLGLLAADPEQMTYPQYLLWAAAQAYQASGETQRAGELLAQAHAALRRKASAIPDPESRATFLQMPFNRELMAAFQRGQQLVPRRAPKPARKLPARRRKA
jgi:DNA-binding SARP family transcriptional activator/predicted ATPase